jgi:hypothetical protein
MIRNDSVASRLAELQPLIEARLKGAEKITQVIEDEVITSLGRVLSASLWFGRSKDGRGFGRIIEDRTPAAEKKAQVAEDRTPCQNTRK